MILQSTGSVAPAPASILGLDSNRLLDFKGLLIILNGLEQLGEVSLAEATAGLQPPEPPFRYSCPISSFSIIRFFESSPGKTLAWTQQLMQLVLESKTEDKDSKDAIRSH
jgi:hypothetical protein